MGTLRRNIATKKIRVEDLDPAPKKIFLNPQHWFQVNAARFKGKEEPVKWEPLSVT